MILAATLATPPAAFAQSPTLSASEIDYPPFCIVDEDGLAGGFSVELMRAALAAVGREVTFRTGPWAEVRGWLERGEIDALPLVGRTPEREFLFDFTFPYMSLHGAIVVRQDTKDIRDLNDLRGRTVAVMKADNAEEFLRREERGIQILTTPTFEEALQELSTGRYDAVVIQRLVALRLIQETGIKNLRVINHPIEGFRQDFCFAVKEGDRETLALLNEGLALVMADGTYRHLHARWFAALEIPSNRRIVVGGDHKYPPFEYLDENGRPAGYNVDLTRAIAREMGLDIEIRLGPWAEIVRAWRKAGLTSCRVCFTCLNVI
jgi:ABC-type amino acid transport substrate-binding protein